jgi:hypothetical protein
MIGIVRGRTLCARVLFHISLSLGVGELLGSRCRRKVRRRGVHGSRRGGYRCRRSILPREQSPQAPAPLHRHGSITSIGGRGGISRLPVHRPNYAQHSIINASRKPRRYPISSCMFILSPGAVSVVGVAVGLELREWRAGRYRPKGPVSTTTARASRRSVEYQASGH